MIKIDGITFPIDLPNSLVVKQRAPIFQSTELIPCSIPTNDIPVLIPNDNITRAADRVIVYDTHRGVMQALLHLGRLQVGWVAPIGISLPELR